MNSIINSNITTFENIEGWSFIICTDGIHTQFHECIINSIISQNIPKFEIIFVTENVYKPPVLCIPTITIIIDSDKPNHITFKKNIGARSARYENLCILHDYLYLGPNWYNGILNFKDTWNVCSFQILNLNGKRMSDWVIYNHPIYNHTLVVYTDPASIYHYVPGLIFCVKKEFILKYPLNEDLTWGQAEDIEWSERIKKDNMWNYKFIEGIYVQSLKLKV